MKNTHRHKHSLFMALPPPPSVSFSSLRLFRFSPLRLSIYRYIRIYLSPPACLSLFVLITFPLPPRPRRVWALCLSGRLCLYCEHHNRTNGVLLLCCRRRAQPHRVLVGAVARRPARDDPPGYVLSCSPLVACWERGRQREIFCFFLKHRFI